MGWGNIVHRHLWVAVLLAGCLQDDLTELPNVEVAFAPEAGGPEGWTVERFDTELICPDGDPAPFYVVYNTSQDARLDETVEPGPLAIVFHSGSFDYVESPIVEDPTAGLHFAGENRLSADWAVRQVFTTLGMYPASTSAEKHTGTLPAALAEAGIPMLLPANCYGDYWHNRTAYRENSFESDLFFRDGRTVAEFAWQYATTEFPPHKPVALPIHVDPAQIHLIGLGEGGRAVGELMAIRDTSGDLAHFPATISVDSHVDDLTAYNANTSLFAETITGLNRIFPTSENPVTSDRLQGAFSWSPWGNMPNRTAYIYSSDDTSIPATAHDHWLDNRAIADTSDDRWNYDARRAEHVLSNADPELAAQLVAFLQGGRAALDPAYLE